MFVVCMTASFNCVYYCFTVFFTFHTLFVYLLTFVAVWHILTESCYDVYSDTRCQFCVECWVNLNSKIWNKFVKWILVLSLKYHIICCSSMFTFAVYYRCSFRKYVFNRVFYHVFCSLKDHLFFTLASFPLFVASIELSRSIHLSVVKQSRKIFNP